MFIYIIVIFKCFDAFLYKWNLIAVRSIEKEVLVNKYR